MQEKRRFPALICQAKASRYRIASGRQSFFGVWVRLFKGYWLQQPRDLGEASQNSQPISLSTSSGSGGSVNSGFSSCRRRKD